MEWDWKSTLTLCLPLICAALVLGIAFFLAVFWLCRRFRIPTAFAVIIGIVLVLVSWAAEYMLLLYILARSLYGP